ncbi:MAG: GNAT family N-acetyltransferase [Chloroflexi bacterium]|nr:GNAT family N-acetyltransferase [Chloroflexota bacterium]
MDEPVLSDLPRAPHHYDGYISLLEAHSPVQKLWTGPAYRFPANLAPTSTHLIEVTQENVEMLRGGLEDWVTDVPHRRPFLAILQASRAVSVCCSVRITSKAHEAGVETLNAFRRKGYASDVVAGWANAVRKMGCIPLYSTSWENTASQGVAKKLALVQYGVDFHVK